MAEIIRNKKFGKLSLQVLCTKGLSPRAKLLYMAIDAICGHKAGEVYHSVKELGGLIGCDAKTTVYNARRELLDLGLIRKESSRKLSYQPLPWENVDIKEGAYQSDVMWWERSGKSA